MAKARKLKVIKAEKRTILKAAAKRKPTKLKTKPEKPGRKKRKDIPAWLEKPVTIRKPRGPDLKPRKRRASMSTTNQKYEGGDIEAEEKAKADKAAKAEADAKAKAKADADAKAYADAEAKAKDEAKAANVQWAAWPKYGSTPTEAEAKARADAEAAAKARAEAAGVPWTPWPKPVAEARNLLEPFALPEGEPPPAADEIIVYDASSGRTKVMKTA